MTALENKLHVKQGATVYECTTYTTPEEATPKGGSCWQIKNNGVTAYLPLSLANSTSPYATPWHIIKDGIEYAVDYIVQQQFNLYYYARDNVTDYQNVTTLPQANIDELTDIVTSNRAAYAFNNCKKLTSLNNVEATWDTANLTDMSYMFSNCEVLTSLDVSDWNTSNVLYMDRPFNNCKALTSLDVSHWDTSNVTYMTGTFGSCEALTSLDVSAWDTSNVRSMSFMFAYCYALASLDVSDWDTSNVTDMGGTFLLCKILTSLDVSGWNTSKVTTTMNMFFGCYALASLDVSNFDTSNVTDMSFTFYQCQALTSLDVSNWNTSKVTNMQQMFRQCQSLTSLDLSDWDTSKVTDMGAMFTGCRSLATLDVSNFDTSKITGLSNMFAYCQALTSLNLSNWNTSNVTSMSYMFDSCAALTTLDVSNFDTSNVTNMTEMFDSCTALTILDVSNWDTSNVTNMKDMFNQDNNLEYLIIDSPTFKFQLLANSKLNNTCKILVPQALISTYQAASNWSDHAAQFEAIENYTITRANGQVTVTPLREMNLYHYAMDNISDYQTTTTLPQANIEELTDIVVAADASQAFHGCSNLTTLSGVETTWRTSNVTSMYLMFYQCGLTDVDFSNWDTSNVTNMSGMFQESKIPNEAFTNFNTSNLTNMSGMFNYWEGGDILDLSHFDMSKVVHAGTVFRRCAAKRIILPSQIGSPDSRLYANDMICGCANLEYLDTSNCTIYTSSIGSDDMITNSGGYLSSLKIADLSGIESLYKLVLAYENGAGASPLSTIIIDRQDLNTWLRNNYVSIPYKPTKQVLLLVPANQIDIISDPDTGGNMYQLVQKCAAVDAIENYDIVHDYENGSITVTAKTTT